MSSAFLYLGIVLMWLCVLVPMWLRRDRHAEDFDAEFVDDDMYGEAEEFEGDTLADLPVSRSSGSAVIRDTDPDPSTDIADDEITIGLGTIARRAAAPGTPLAATGSLTTTSGTPTSAATPGATGSPVTTAAATDSRTGTAPGIATPRDGTSSTLAATATATITGSRAPGPVSTHRKEATEKPTGGSSEAPSNSTSGTDPHSTREAVPAGTIIGDDGGALDISRAEPSPTECRRRARVMARRRRWLLWTVLLHLASVVTAAIGVAPWWSVAPSGVLLVAYLAALRVSVAMDAERRQAAAEARAERARRAREERHALEIAAQQAEAEIIEFRRRIEPFDQYADRSSRRAVGD